MAWQSLKQLDLKDKRVLVREDFNVPFKTDTAGRTLTSDARLIAALPTLKYILKQDAQLIIMGHLGRPAEGSFATDLSLDFIIPELEKLLGIKVRLVRDYLNQKLSLNPKEVILLENTRFNQGEADNDITLSNKLANLADVCVMDAFAVSHRAHSSTCGFLQAAQSLGKQTAVGFLAEQELNVLTKLMQQPKRPLVAIVSGAKVSTKLGLIENLVDNLLQKGDGLILGGGIANTFLKAEGFEVGASLVEDSLVELSRSILSKAASKKIIIPKLTDAVVAQALKVDAKGELKLLSNLKPQDMILDLGTQSTKAITDIIDSAGMILWNGPLGVFEIDAFATATHSLSQAIAKSSAISVAGGGDTLAAIEKFNISNQVSYISTGGGAFLEFIEGKVPEFLDFV